MNDENNRYAPCTGMGVTAYRMEMRRETQMRGITLVAVLIGVVFWAFTISDTKTLSYAPSDLWIKTALEAIMERDGRFDLEHIDVSVREGIVKLTGSVFTSDEKGLAELLAVQVPGVKAIEDDIFVIPALNQDLALEKESRSVLFENPLLHIVSLKVHAKDGIITLNGIVYGSDEKHLANKIVAMLPGVQVVRNQIEVLHQA
jgi:osmotically-inducible protein OsmY